MAKGKGRPRAERPDTFEGRLGARVEAARKSRGMTAGELADAARVGLGTVARIERGAASPTVASVLAIANALGLSGDQLMKKVPDWTRKPD